MLRTDGNRTEEAYATNYQKQPSVAVFFCGSIIKKLRAMSHAASFHFFSAGFFRLTEKCYYEFLKILDRIYSDWSSMLARLAGHKNATGRKLERLDCCKYNNI